MKRWLEVSLVPSLVVVAVLACVLCDPSSLQSDVPVSRPNEGLSTASDTLDKEGEAISLDGLSVEQLKQAREQAVKRHFEAEVDRMMKIIVNSLYKNKEIFLRELISNASDALDKIRVLALTNSEVLEESDEMNIRIKANKETRTLHIIDTGIGMTEAELTSNLGTIAKSGTSEFLANITQATSSSEKSDLIGQFGVGFYSSFLVANKVMVVSKSDADNQHIWESNSTSFSVYRDPRGNTLKRGTEIILYLTDEAEDYLQPETLKEVVKKYSQFINFPIYVWSSRTESQSIEPEEKDDTKTSDSEASVEEESVKKTEGKTVDKVVWDWVRVNANKPIWRRKPSDVTDKEYNELFHVYSKDYDDPLARIHFTGEGDVMFNSILYIPKRSPSNIFQMHSSHSDRIKLYVRRVYISDVADDLLPKYLAFVVGIVDSDELPLNVSREMLQQNKLLKAIKKRLVKKVIEMISKLTESDFEKFWSEYSVNIKLGIIDDHSNRSKLSKILRFWTSNSSEKQSSLADYVSRMKKGQDEIYYITAASLNEAKSSPFVERLTKKGYEIIYMVDPVDEYMLQSLTEYDKKKLRNVAKGAIELDKSDGAKTRKEALQKEFEPLLEWFKENLKEYVDQTALSERLLNTPCALVANEFGWSGNMERIMTAQAYQRGGDPSTTYYATMKKVFEINPRHPVMKKLNNLIKSNRNDPTINHTANLLFDVAVLRSGFSVKSPVAFAERVESVVKKSLDIDPTEMVEQEQEVDDESNDKVIVTDEEVEEKPISSESVTENASEESLQDNIYKDIWRQNRTEGSKLSSSELGSISEHSRRIPVIPSSESDILSEFGAIQKCPTCRRLLGCNSRVHTTRSESSVADDSTDVKYEKDDRYQVIEDDDDNDNEDDEISDNQIETDDDKEEEEVDEDSGVDLGEEISESNIKTTFRHMRKLEESIDDDDDHDDTDNDDSDTEYRNCLSMCASRHKKKQYLRYTVTNKSEQEDEQDDDADEEGDHDEEDLVLLSVAETKTTPSNPKSLSDASVDKQQVNEEKTLKTTEQKSEEITKEQNISKQKDGDNDEEDSDDADDDEVDSHHQEDEDDSDNDDDDNNSDVPRSDCHQGVRNDKQFLREDEDADANDVEDDGEENDDVNTDTPDADDDAGDDDDEQVVSTEYKFDMSKTKSSGHNQHTNVKVEEDYTNEYDETEDVEEESEDDQPEDLDLEISAEEGYEDVDDPDFSDWIEADEELNPNWPGSRKLMTVKTTSSPTAKSKSHSEPVSGNAKNKKPATTTKGKTTTKTPTPKISESQKYKQSKEKSPPNQHHQQNQPDKSKSPPSTKHTEDNSKKIIPKSVPQQEKSKKPIVSNLNSKATVPKSKHVRIVGNINDHDCDGIPDDIDEDVDNDGLLDRTQDSDWDGLLNHIDEDDDNDGIPDVEDEDSNGDGILDCRTDVSDIKLKVRYKKKMRKIDSDFDGIPDDVDGDDDDDGIPDIMEDEDKDQIPDFLKLTHSDFLKGVSNKELNKRMNKRGWYDHDCDGIPDHLDPDDDNDGYFDAKQDSDRDGVLNEFDDDDDNDGIPDSEDLDSNGDGIPDCIVKDTDGDHIPDHIDTDDDNDGIPDLQDPDHPMFDYFRDSDMDGIPDTLDKDDDNDGIPDSIDFDSDGDGSDDLFQDVDKDGVPDSVDDDMNNDGIPDHRQDHDCDGIPDIIDPDDDNDGYFDTKQDSDNDGILNEWDDDDDNDGIPDIDDEDSNGDGIIDCQPHDSDGDGIPDHLDEDDDNDGIPDQKDPDSMSFLLYKHKRFLEAVPAHIARHEANLLNVDLGDPNDKDCDGIPDHIDNDLDNDGKIDRTQDSDMDGLLNHIDEDDDNDGIPDVLDPDANGDGIPDCRRDGGLHYKLVKSPSGLIKKVLRIREPTQEEQHMAYMVNEAKRKLIRIRARLGEPVPKNTIQAVPSVAFKNNYEDNPDSSNNDNHGSEKKSKVKSVPAKLGQSNLNVKNDHSHTPTTSKHSSNNKPANTGTVNTKKTTTQGTKINPSSVKQQPPSPSNNEHGVKSTNKRQNRKLASYVATEHIDPFYALNKDILLNVQSFDNDIDDRDEEDDETSINLAEPNLKTSVIGSFLLPGAAADEMAGQRKTKPLKVKQNEVSQPMTNDKLKAKKQKVNKNNKIEISSKSNKKKEACDARSCQNSNENKHPHPKDTKYSKSASITAYLHEDDDYDDEISVDSDGDGIPDYLEDEDGDGIPDYLEDEDGDGIPDNLAGDSDGDGIPDYQEDENENGIPDYLEDEDEDGIPDYLDGCVHSKSKDDDDDNDGIKDHHEAKDTDGDGIPDYLDDDDDGDGIPDVDDDDDVKENKPLSKPTPPKSQPPAKSKQTAPPKKVHGHVTNHKHDNNEDDDDDDDNSDNDDDEDSDSDKKPSKRKDSGIVIDDDDEDDETDDAEHMSKARSIVLSILKRIENIFGVEDNNDNDDDDNTEGTHDH